MVLYLGAGSRPAGSIAAGQEVPNGFSAVAILPSLDAGMVPLFDISTKQFVRDPVTNLVKMVHWVDQAVALALGVNAGKFSAQTSLGNKIRQIRRNTPERLQSGVEDAVNVALASLLDRKDITLMSVRVTTPVVSQILVSVYYVNLRMPTSTPTVSTPKSLNMVF